MKKLLQVIVPTLFVTAFFTTMILASSYGNKQEAQINSEAKQAEREIRQLEDDLKELRDDGIVTPEDNVKENQLMEQIAQKEIANGTYDYDYKMDLQRCVNTLNVVVAEYNRTIASGYANEDYKEYVKESRKLWGELADKYQKILDEDLLVDEYKNACENYYEDDAQITKYLDEKYFN